VTALAIRESVVELAAALATLRTRPKRSILFMTFFGEEKGLLGSRYYGRHSVVPIEKTVADVNLEKLGRTDDVEGPHVGAAVMTGYGYIDYANIARVDRMVAQGLLLIADNPVEPKCNESNPKAARYLKAWKVRRGR